MKKCIILLLAMVSLSCYAQDKLVFHNGTVAEGKVTEASDKLIKFVYKGEDVVNTILQARPKRIVYVSCNPATQARDLALMDAQYKVAAVRPVDMFPHTPHVENVVLLEVRE